VSCEAEREVLPIPDRPDDGPIHEDAKDPAATSRRSVRCACGRAERAGRPARRRGLGCSSAFGGPCATPTAERLARGGLKFSRFHIPRGQPLDGHGRVGADRHRRGRRGPRPSHHPRRAAQDRDEPPV